MEGDGGGGGGREDWRGVKCQNLIGTMCDAFTHVQDRHN